MSKIHRFRYVDCYGQVYTTVWEYSQTGSLDITTEIRQPYVWGEPLEGYVSKPEACSGHGRNIFRKGIKTIQRQIVEVTDTGYEIVMEGEMQIVEVMQFSFNCVSDGELQAIDPFLYHLGGIVVDDYEDRVAIGPRFADPDEPNDEEAVWGEVDQNGNVLNDLGQVELEYVDVWTN